MEQPTSDEKVLAAIAHASVLLSFLGPVGATLVWVFQRNKSKYVRYHALQAMGYQAFMFWAWIIGMFVFMFGMIAISIGLAIVADNVPSTPPEAIFFLQPLFMLLIFGIWGLMFLFGFVGAVFCMLGKDFRYPFIGSWLQKKILNEQNEEEAEKWEDFWVAGICHATAILQLWGIIIPVIVWFTQKDRSPRLKFQSLQAAIYQLIATVTYMLSFAGFFFVYILFIAVLAIGGISSSPEQVASPVVGVILAILMAIFSIVWLAWLIFYPIYLILAGIGAIHTIRGHDFKYPIVGGIIAKRMSTTPSNEVIQA